MVSAHNIFIRKPEGKRPLGRARRSWEAGTEVDRREIGWEGVNWIDLAHDKGKWRLNVYRIMNLWVSFSAVNCFTDLHYGTRKFITVFTTARHLSLP